MDTIDQIEQELPWGFHDSILTKAEIDWLQSVASVLLRVAMTESQDFDRLGRLTFDGLVFFAIEPPEINAAAGYTPTTTLGFHVDSGEGFGHESCRERLPPIPEGCFLRWIFVREWNRFIHVCARGARFEWIEEQAVPRVSKRRALFPGTEVVARDRPTH